MPAKEDRWVVVSGAGGALGSALVAHYGRQGRRVLALDRQFDRDDASHEGITIRIVDLLMEEDVSRVIGEIADGISLLVNAAGQIWNEPLLAFQGGKLLTHSVENWRKINDANLTAPFIVAKHVATHMVRHGGGCIVNFSSIVSSGNAGQAAYGAAKAGIEGLTQSMAIELGPLGVRVNALALGFIDVATTRRAIDERRVQQYRERTPLGRLGRLDDVISAVEFLAGNTFVNGAIVRVDGGLRL